MKCHYLEKKVVATQNEWINNKSEQECDVGDSTTKIKVERRRWKDRSVFKIESG